MSEQGSARAAEERLARIEQTLREAFAPQQLEITDSSHRHRGHPGAKSGGGHFSVRIVAECFRGVPRIGRHRMVYDALREQLAEEIHALSVAASAPDEPPGR